MKHTLTPLHVAAGILTLTLFVCITLVVPQTSLFSASLSGGCQCDCIHLPSAPLASAWSTSSSSSNSDIADFFEDLFSEFNTSFASEFSLASSAFSSTSNSEITSNSSSNTSNSSEQSEHSSTTTSSSSSTTTSSSSSLETTSSSSSSSEESNSSSSADPSFTWTWGILGTGAGDTCEAAKQDALHQAREVSNVGTLPYLVERCNNGNPGVVAPGESCSYPSPVLNNVDTMGPSSNCESSGGSIEGDCCLRDGTYWVNARWHQFTCHDDDTGDYSPCSLDGLSSSSESSSSYSSSSSEDTGSSSSGS